MKSSDSLWVIMPVYNEEVSVTRVLDEWIPHIRAMNIKCTFLALNDGSKDNTLNILKSAVTKYPEIQIIDKVNSGHGQSCVLGYRTALKAGADYVFQIDSDGQCDPQYFNKVWELRGQTHSVFGLRVTRDDGLFRMFASRIVSVVTFLATGTWVVDANVPYRLMPQAILKDVVDKVPNEIYLANILVSVLARRAGRIKWVKIHFRDRFGGSPSVKPGSFFRQGKLLFRQLKSALA